MTRRDLHALLAHAADPRPDADLLRDPLGFPELVRRHGPLVWAACRRLSPDPADAFQAVFLALSRSAGRIRTPAALGSWLHAACVRVCLQQRRTIARRRLREKRAARPEADVPVPDSAWERILAAAHEEIDRLPAHERTVFVLCELQGVPAGEAARQLGWKPGTLTGRLSKARARLLRNLSARGLAPVVGLAAAGAVPPEVAALASPAATVPAGVLALSREVTAMVGLKHLAAGVLVAGSLLAGVGGVLVRADGDQPAGPAGKQAPRPMAKPPELPLEAPPELPPRDIRADGQPMSVQPTRPQWEHQMVDKPSSRQEFDKLLADRGRDGWEFAGVVGLSQPIPPPLGGPAAASAEVLVFKRPVAPSAAQPVSTPVAGRTLITGEPPTVARQRMDRIYPNGDADSVTGAVRAVWDTASLPWVSVTDNGRRLTVEGPPDVLKRVGKLLDELEARGGKPHARSTQPVPLTLPATTLPPAGHAPGLTPPPAPTSPQLEPPLSPASNPPATVGGFQAIVLRHARATDTAKVLTELFANYRDTVNRPKLVVSADVRRNLILFSSAGDRSLEDEVRKLVAELDVPK